MGEYYYVEVKKSYLEVNVLHKSGGIKHTILNYKMAFIGTFYRVSGALLTARKRFKSCKSSSRCCTALKQFHRILELKLSSRNKILT